MNRDSAIFALAIVAALVGGFAGGVVVSRPVQGPPAVAPADQISARETVIACQRSMNEIVLQENKSYRDQAEQMRGTISELKEEVTKAHALLMTATVNVEETVKARCSGKKR